MAESASSGGIGFVGLLTILFIGLKLTHFIDWSWFWVLSPIIFSFSVVMLLLLGVGSYFLIRWIFSK